MRSRWELWSGPAAGLLFLVGTVAIGMMTPGYSYVRQTVSELGEVGSPGRFAFSMLLGLVAACLLQFARAAQRALRASGQATSPAWFIAAMAIACAGVGVFPFPHPLHNVFGLSETVGLQAPLAAALAGGSGRGAGRLSRFSGVLYALVLVAIAVNLLPLFRPAGLWPHLRPFFGLIQRSLFASWFLWCFGYGWLLAKLPRPDAP